eukprot:30525-Pelagococcus_subviridis.AAC.4
MGYPSAATTSSGRGGRVAIGIGVNSSPKTPPLARASAPDPPSRVASSTKRNTATSNVGCTPTTVAMRVVSFPFPVPSGVRTRSRFRGPAIDATCAAVTTRVASSPPPPPSAPSIATTTPLPCREDPKNGTSDRTPGETITTLRHARVRTSPASSSAKTAIASGPATSSYG